MKRWMSKDNLAIAFVCFVISFMIIWQLKSVYSNTQKSKIETLRLTQLQEELINEKHNNELLKSRIDELLKDNQKIKDKKSAEEQLKLDIKRASMIAGLLPTFGEGVKIVLSNTFDYMVTESNLLEVINELRATGAEAIEVNGERLVATSEVREAGNRIVINGVRMSSPYEIKAIGNSNKLYRGITMLGGVKDSLGIFIDFSIQKDDKIYINAVRDDGTVIKTDYMKETE